MKRKKHLGVALLVMLMCVTAIPVMPARAENQKVDVKGQIQLSTNELILDESDAPDYCGQVDVTVVLEGDYSETYSAVALPYQCDQDEDGILLMYMDSEKSGAYTTVYTASMYFGTQKKASTYTFSKAQLYRFDGVMEETTFAKKSFVFDKQFADKEPPKLVSVSVDKQGQITNGNLVKVTIKVQDNGELRKDSCNQVVFDTPMGDDGYYNIITLTYQGDGVYTAYTSMFTPYEWYICGIKIYDVAGNCCFVEYDQTSPYYFYVEMNGVCNKTVFENLKVYLYNDEGELLETIVKDVERRSTIGEVLGEEYINGSNHENGQFLGWSTQMDGNVMNADTQFMTPYKEMITSINLYEVYDKTENEEPPKEEPPKEEPPQEEEPENPIVAQWMLDAKGWWYQNADGSYPHAEFKKIDGVTYYFNGAGYMVTGWQQVGGTWYYFNPSGAMVTGWQKDGGIWYYLNANGAMVTGWKQVGGIWYYFNASGAMVTGWQYIGGTWYYLNVSGAMVTGWKQVGGIWYYFETSGAMVKNRWVGNYYLQADGSMATNKWIGRYYVGANGAWIP